MADGTLTYVIPVRDPQGVRNWTEVKQLIAQTLAALTTHPKNTRIVIAAQQGTELPDLPSGALLVEVDRPYQPLPAEEGEVRWMAVRADKGARLVAGIVAAQPQGHVMVVDYDDFVSPRIADLVADQPESPGWVVDHGYAYDGGPFVLKLNRFNRTCGTSLIVRADLLRIPTTLDAADPDWVARSLGSHVFLRDDLAQAGTPLTPTPFPGAVYRVGHAANTSRIAGIRAKYFPVRRSIRHPRWALTNIPKNIRGLRRLDSIRQEFGLPS